MNFIKYLFLFSLLFLFYTFPTHAASRFSILGNRPTPDPSPFQVTRVAKSMGQQNWDIGTQISFGFGNLTEPGANRDVIRSALVDDLFVAVSIKDWLTLGFDMPFVVLNNFQDPVTPGFSSDTDLGDLRMEFKITFLSPDQYTAGFALLPFMHVPTGNQNHFVGDQNVVGGFLFVIDSQHFDRWTLATNFGFQAQEKVDFGNINLSGAMLIGSVGGSYQILRDKLELGLEIAFRSPFSGLFKEAEESPLEILAQARYQISDSAFWLTGGGGFGLFHGGGAPLARGLIGLRFQPTTTHKKSAKKEETWVEKPEPAIEPLLDSEPYFETIYFKPQSAEIEVDQLPALKRAAENLLNHPQKMVVLEGYADSANAKNSLASKRVKVVYDFLIKSGVERERIRSAIFITQDGGRVVLKIGVVNKPAPKPVPKPKNQPLLPPPTY